MFGNWGYCSSKKNFPLLVALAIFSKVFPWKSVGFEVVVGPGCVVFHDPRGGWPVCSESFLDVWLITALGGNPGKGWPVSCEPVDGVGLMIVVGNPGKGWPVSGEFVDGVGLMIAVGNPGKFCPINWVSDGSELFVLFWNTG